MLKLLQIWGLPVDLSKIIIQVHAKERMLFDQKQKMRSTLKAINSNDFYLKYRMICWEVVHISREKDRWVVRQQDLDHFKQHHMHDPSWLWDNSLLIDWSMQLEYANNNENQMISIQTTP